MTKYLTWVWVPDGSLEQSLAVLGCVGGDDLEARAVGVPGGEALRVLSAHTHCSTIWTTEYHRDVDLEQRESLALVGKIISLIVICSI